MSPSNSNVSSHSQSKSKSTSRARCSKYISTTPCLNRSVYASRVRKPSPTRLSRTASQLHTAKLQCAVLVLMEAEETSSSADSELSDEGEVMMLDAINSDPEDEEEEEGVDEYESDGIDEEEEDEYEVDGEYEAKNWV
jgi:hypothetical protein